MSQPNPETLHELYERIRSLPYGPEELALTEEAVRLADLSGDEAEGYTARRLLMSSAFNMGQSDKMLVAFSWCRDYADRHPQALNTEEHEDLLWHQRWVAMVGPTFPQIPAGRIEALLADYARRMRELGYSRHNEAYVQLNQAMHTGNMAEANQHFALWEATSRDPLSACEACEAQTAADYQLFLGDDEAALKQIQHILDKELTCAHIPTNTHALALAPLMRLGRWDEAAGHAARSRQTVSGDPDHLWAQSRHLEYLALTNPSAALKWYAHHLLWAEQTREMGVQQDFHAASAMLFKVIGKTVETVKIRLPQAAHGYQPSGEYSVMERQNYHESEARRIAGLFDTRNGSGQQTKEVEKVLALAELMRA